MDRTLHRFHKTAEGLRHPNTMSADEVERFLTYLAVQRRVSASTQNQAFAALLFLYRDVLHLGPGDVDALRARVRTENVVGRRIRRQKRSPALGASRWQTRGR